MSVDSDVFVVADKDKAAEVGQAVFDAVDRWQKKELDKLVESIGYTSRIAFLFSEKNENADGSRKWTNGLSIYANSFDCFQLQFTVNNEHRILWYFTDCSCDTDHVTEEHTLLFSIGHWGQHGTIMQVVIEALKPFGPVYYDHNDCDEHGYVLQN